MDTSLLKMISYTRYSHQLIIFSQLLFLFKTFFLQLLTEQRYFVSLSTRKMGQCFGRCATAASEPRPWCGRNIFEKTLKCLKPKHVHVSAYMNAKSSLVSFVIWIRFELWKLDFLIKQIFTRFFFESTEYHYYVVK